MRPVLHQEKGEGLEPVATTAAYLLLDRKQDKVAVCLAHKPGFRGQSTKIFVREQVEAVSGGDHSKATAHITAELEKLQVPA